MTTTTSAPDALAVFDAVMTRAGAGLPAALTITDDRGTSHPVDPATWCRGHLPGDRRLLARCAGPTLDVGCGPGRLTGALNRLGHPALGIDVSAAAVRIARARGAVALRRDVFGPLPGRGRWRHLLLADGNIGIGGDPGALLRRCRDLLAADGRLHVELARPGTRSWAGDARLHDGTGRPGAPFRWAQLAADDLAATTDASALRVLAEWTEADRWFATLTPA
ncbi:methyltransferase domain-containing protein [Amorphoplanes digitatis]|uniref:SAM-dependent methyltransferase n=1 Tax=Actinoplanes digitatis TaxID=1868 RepID=A0A7W7HVG8_9ACTN|nr:methyltransferase domain-containing protein [Actinoplanes digitatis]MBB4761536.1 SAM-dependent methyltransferase [Actinoplanes digitatis]BFE70069.1 class I SAM-dependent methyltransferase [Actinoplanes digitatis]GID90644.1 methyltransferase type 12 [Actinoplanes digitatis]